MLDTMFKIHKSPGINVSIALELLGYACSDDLHGTNYFDSAVVMHNLRKVAIP